MRRIQLPGSSTSLSLKGEHDETYAKMGGLGERVAKLKDGESIVLECEGNLAEEARKIRNGLNGITACVLVRRSVGKSWMGRS